MPDDTTFLTKTGEVTKADSTVFGVSVRAWIAITLVATVCATHLCVGVAVLVEAVLSRDFAKVGTYTTIGEPLYSMSVAALGFYFGQKQNQLGK